MRNYMLMAAIAAVAASPASARDNSGYVAVDIGALLPTGTSVNGKVTDETAGVSLSASDFAKITYKSGYDADLIGGYDFGRFRLEGEAGYKHAGLDNLHFPASTLGTTYDVPLDGGARVLSGMVNGLVNFGEPGFRAFAGGGIGIANVRFSGGGLSASDTEFAWQLLAGVYVPVDDRLDLGVKYRYFRTGELKFPGTANVAGDVLTGQLSGHFASHSILVSLVYNFTAPVPPRLSEPAMAPPPPNAVVQTCPDGSTLPLASVCPASPVAPPPPASRPERG